MAATLSRLARTWSSTEAIGVLLAACVVGASTLLVWGSQYYVDYEVTLLPWLLSRGWVLYRDVADQHSPLFPALLVPFGGAGDPEALHMVIVGLHLTTLLLAWAVASRMGGVVAGLVSVTLAGLWARAMEGTHLWYDGALAPVYLGALLLLLKGELWKSEGGLRVAASPGVAFLVGLLLGVGVLIKQHAVLAVPFVAVAMWVAEGNGRWRRMAALLAGVGGPLLVAAGVYAAQGALGEMLYWVVLYSLTSDYASRSAMSPGASEWPVLAALYALVATLLLAWGGWKGRSWPALVVFLGLVVAASVPAWPRYGRFHLQALAPLAGVAGGVAVALLWNRLRSPGFPKVMAVAALLLLVGSAFFGVREWRQGLVFNFRPGRVAAPYGGSLQPLRAWVEQHAPSQSPIFIYGLDPMLYRLLEREPTRPWAPPFAWIMAARDTEARWWEGFERARPPAVLVPAGEWDAPLDGELGDWEGRIRGHYREAGRFSLVIYRGARAVEVVALLRQGTGER